MSHMRRQFKRGAAEQVRCRWRGAAGVQQSGKHAHTQVAIQTHTQRNWKINGGIRTWVGEPSHNVAQPQPRQSAVYY